MAMQRSTLRTALSNKLGQTRGPAGFLLAAAVVGVLVGLASSALILTIEWADERLFSIRALTYGLLFVAVITPIGIGISWFIERRWGPGIKGSGITETMVGLNLHAGYIPTRTVQTKLVATVATVGSGGSLGSEGPAVQVGSAVGSSLARYTNFGEDRIRSLVAAGAGAGIGASFNAPIAGMLFAMEVVLGNFAIRHINAVVIAAVSAAVTAKSILGDDKLLSAPAHELQNAPELLLYLALGLLAGSMGVLFIKMLKLAHTTQVPKRLPQIIRPLVAGLILAGVSAVRPEVLGVGRGVVESMLSLDSTADLVWTTLLFLGVLKLAMAAVTEGGYGAGGVFMPSLFAGATLGAAFATIVTAFWPLAPPVPGAFAVVGMAATFAAVARAPLTAIIIVFEITGDYGLVVPLMLATTLAMVIADYFDPDSAYTMPLTLKGIHLQKPEDIDLLDTVTVGEVMSYPGTLEPSMTGKAALDCITEGRHHGLAVTDNGKLVGILTLTDIANCHEDLDEILIHQLMTEKPITVVPSMPVSAALARMAALNYGRLPVVSDDDRTTHVGMFRRESVVRAYHRALSDSTGRHMYRDRLKQRTQPGASFYEIPIPRNSACGTKSVRDIRWPDAATLVSIRRGSAVIIPHGDTTLRAGDVVTAFGTGESREELAWIFGQSDETDEDL
jgi:chloride channel protein, CIC family